MRKVNILDCIRRIATFFIMVIFFVGCSNVRPQASLTDHSALSIEERLHEDGKRFAKTVAVGSIAGAIIIGGLICAAGALSGDGRIAAAACAGGVAVGYALGKQAGYYVAKQKQDFANEERRIDSMITDVQIESDALTIYLATAKDYIEISKKAITDLNSIYSQKHKLARSEKTKLESIKVEKEGIAKSIAVLKQKKNAFEHAAVEQIKKNGAHSVTSLDDQIVNMEVKIAELEWQLNSLVIPTELSRAI